MHTIDLRPGTRDIKVPTSVVRGGIAYMGPDVLVKANNREHAKQIAIANGHTPNKHFGPTENGKELLF